SSGVAALALLGTIISANPRSFDLVKAATAMQSCATILFGETATTGSAALSETNYTATGIDFSLTTSTKVYSDGSGFSAKFGSSTGPGKITFGFAASLVTSVRLYAYQYGSDGVAAVSLTTSALASAKTASISSTSMPVLDDLSGINIYLFTGLDNDSGASSTSLTIESDGSNRFHLAKILFTLSGASIPTSSSEPTSSSISSLATMTLNSSLTLSGAYDTGNYGTVSSGSTSFGFYRTFQDSGTLVRLIAPSYSGSIAGSFYNIDAIKQITKITLNYKTASPSDADAKLYAGDSSLLTNCQSIAATSGATSLSFDFSSSDNVAYFRIDGGASDLTLYSLTIVYLDGVGTHVVYGSSGASLYRINPVVFSGSLISGVSSVSVPTSIVPNGSTYSVSASKTYTYYTYAAVSANSSLADAAAYTEPADVAAYFIAFKHYPANFVTSSNYATAYSYFRRKTRCVSAYTRTDGYVTSVPYAPNGTSIAAYYECDIDLTGSYAASSSSASRGVGRLVVFSGGFSSSKGATAYDSSYTAVFTDDHYATFQEYYNYGAMFSTRVDAEQFRTSYRWGCPSVLDPA
ncbi:MAG: hypothetical protein WCS90_03735, partial [Bacilli bacterium]